MGQVPHKAEKLQLRIRRLRGQLDAAARSIESEAACTTVLQSLVACRGALNSLIAEVVEDHVRANLRDPDKSPRSKESQAARELIDVLKTYLK
jgi:DNA-binding FrmR family transcriptional regulator